MILEVWLHFRKTNMAVAFGFAVAFSDDSGGSDLFCGEGVQTIPGAWKQHFKQQLRTNTAMLLRHLWWTQARGSLQQQTYQHILTT